MQTFVVDIERLLHETLQVYGGHITSPETIDSDVMVRMIEVLSLIHTDAVFRKLTPELLPYGLLARRLASRLPLERMTSVVPGAPGKPWVFYID